MEKITIKETKNYNMFKKLTGNRDLTSVKKIVDSIYTVGYIPNPIICNENYEVIDGQNRLEALRQLKMPIQYYIVEGLTIDDARAMNIGRSNWKPIDYAKSFADEGRQEFILFLKLIDNNPNYSFQILFNIARNQLATSGIDLKNCIINGHFKFSQQDYYNTQKILNLIDKCYDSLKSIPGSRRTIISGAAWCLRQKQCDNERFINVINKRYPKIRPVCDNPILYFSDLSEIYNLNLKDSSKKVYFDYLYKTKSEG